MIDRIEYLASKQRFVLWSGIQHCAAKELLDNPKIAARLRALREMHQERHLVSIDSITAELEASRKLATEDKQHSAAITPAAVRLSGRKITMFVCTVSRSIWQPPIPAICSAIQRAFAV